MLRGKGRVEEDVLDFDNSFGELVDFLVPFEEDAIPVGKVENTQEGGRLAICFDLLDDQVRHGIRCERALLDLLSGCQAEKLVSPLQVSHGVEHYCQGGASCHGVRARRIIVNLAVHPKWQVAVLYEVQLVPVHYFAWG
jgi:hypothetical protein